MMSDLFPTRIRARAVALTTTMLWMFMFAGGFNAIRKETPVPELDYAKYLWLEKEIKSVANVTKTDAEEFLPIAARIPIQPTIEIFPLEQANDVLVKIKHSQLKAAAVLTIDSL